MSPVRWFWVGDHGKVGHAFGASTERSLCGVGPAWIALPPDRPGVEYAKCQKCRAAAPHEDSDGRR